MGISWENVKNTHRVTLGIDASREDMTGWRIEIRSRDLTHPGTKIHPLQAKPGIDTSWQHKTEASQIQKIWDLYLEILGRMLLGLNPWYSGTGSYPEESGLGSCSKLNWSRKYNLGPTQTLYYSEESGVNSPIPSWIGIGVRTQIELLCTPGRIEVGDLIQV